MKTHFIDDDAKGIHVDQDDEAEIQNVVNVAKKLNELQC